MIYPHVIRLRGPWHFEVSPVVQLDLEATGAAAAIPLAPRSAGSAPLPHDWISGIASPAGARICWRRRFSRPTNLDPGEAIWLCIAGRGATLAVALNGDCLGTIDGAQAPNAFEVTSFLKARNELTIDVQRPADRQASTPRKTEANVWLEIRHAE
ncbi:MAG: hypothetical protein K2Y37_22230 [Pirellulales bacterium]|nr:hypothetical protein [Pirellulales bacterium]